MEALFSSGRIADLILGLLVLEVVALSVVGRQRRLGLLAVAAPTLLSGAALLLALRGALVDAWWGWIAAALLLGLFAHVWDLAARFARHSLDV